MKTNIKRNEFKKIKSRIKEIRLKSLDCYENQDREFVEISIVAIYKNEPDIIEWIEYHKLLGVDRFYLYDNESTDSSREKLQPYINEGTVVYHYIAGKSQQIPVYRDAIYRYKNQTKWLAIIDLDEYILPIEKDNLKDLMKDYEQYPALGINWLVFDSNGFINRPDKLVIEAYTRIDKRINIRENRHIKSIVNPREVKYIFNPHFCIYKGHKVAVNENFLKIGKYNNINNVKNAFTPKVSIKKIRINHYHTKSYEDYCKKVGLGFADSQLKRDFKPKRLNFRYTKHDYKIQKYLFEFT